MAYKLRLSRLALTAVLMTAVTVLPAYAQYDSNGGSLSNRLDRIERDITILSQQVYNGKTPPAAAVSYSDANTADSSLMATLQVRLDAMEETVRQLNGRVEEQTYQIQQLQDQMTKIQTDTDMRLQGLETRPATPSSTMPPVSSGSSLRPDETAPPPAPTPQNNAQLDGGSATQMYDQAFGYIRSGDYAQAEQAFTGFLNAYPQDKLAANAEYWLGETFYVRGQYDKAASAFARGYQNHPKSTKASDNLLKLALSLGALNRKDDACLALVQLENDFPKATQALKDRVGKEKEKLSCP